MKMKNRDSKFFAAATATAVAMAIAVLLIATAAYAQAAAILQSCSNGVQDENETGVDCGGSCALTVGCVGNCTSAFIVDYCDGKDNDKDCLVDEDCKQDEGRKPVTGVAPIKGSSSDGQQKAASCSDSIRNQDEVGIDCGGVCTTSAKEVCDSVDNDNNCLIDDAEECRKPKAAPGTGEFVPTSAPALEPIAAPVAESAAGQDSAQAHPPSMPTEESPSSQPALANGSSGLSQEDATLQTSQIRQFAKKNSIYIPEAEPDSELLKKYLEFGKKHEAEFEANFRGEELTENDIAGVLKQFSEETYPKLEPEPQSQSFFSKVSRFFKRLLG